jgi:hypothetical protein
MASRDYLVSAADISVEGLAALARRLSDAGFTLTQQLDAVGVLLGRADEATVPSLLATPGVMAIEEVRTDVVPSSDNDNA